MAAGDVSQLPATIAASRSVEKALEEAASSGALNLSNRKLKEFPRTAKNYDLSDITYAGKQFTFPSAPKPCVTHKATWLFRWLVALVPLFCLTSPPPAFSVMWWWWCIAQLNHATGAL